MIGFLIGLIKWCFIAGFILGVWASTGQELIREAERKHQNRK